MSPNLRTGLTRPSPEENDAWEPFVCGHCGTRVSGAVVMRVHQVPPYSTAIKWLLCPECYRGSVKNGSEVMPGHGFAPQIAGLPDTVEEAYEETRQCMSVNAYTAAELLCRKLLMHVAVDKEAKPGKPFEYYLDYLAEKGYIAPAMKGWVGLIRKHGNQSTHKLPAPDRKRAESTVMFTAELLRIVYEMDHMASLYVPPDDKPKAE